jgi:hemoglobin
MNCIGAAFAAALLAASACRPAETAVNGKQPDALITHASLYQRLGGYDALAAVTDDFLARMLGDPKMAPYFENLDSAGTARVRQMIVDQLCAATGGPCVYVGADMATAHKGLDISEAAFDVAARYLTETLDQFKVPEKEKAEVLAFVGSTRKDIVGK